MSYTITEQFLNFLADKIEGKLSPEELIKKYPDLDLKTAKSSGKNVLLYFEQGEDKIALTKTTSSSYLAAKAPMLKMIDDDIKKIKSEFSCPPADKQTTGLILFALKHCTSSSTGQSLLTWRLNLTSNVRIPMEYSNYRQIVSALSWASELKSLDKSKLFSIVKVGIDSKLLKSIDNGNIGQLLIVDLIYKSNKQVIDWSDKTLSSQSDKIKIFLKNKFPKLKGKELNVNKVLSEHDPVKCTLLQEDDVVMGEKFVNYTMDKIDTIINLSGYCFSVSYLATGIVGTRGLLHQVLNSAPMNKEKETLIVQTVANYYSQPGNIKEFNEDIMPAINAYDTETKETIGKKIPIDLQKGDAYAKLVIFFEYMLNDFQNAESIKGLKKIYLKTNGLILDVISYLGYICISDDIGAQADSKVPFKCATHSIALFLDFIDEYKKDIENFSANGDTLAAIIKDIPTTCIHGIGSRLVAFYIAIYEKVENFLKGLTNKEKRDLLYIPEGYDVADDEIDKEINDLMKISPLILIDKSKNIYATSVAAEYNHKYNSHPLYRYNHTMVFEQAGKNRRWNHTTNNSYAFNNKENLLRFNINEKPHHSPITYHSFTRFNFDNDTYTKILNISEKFQFDRKIRYEYLIEHAKNVINLMKNRESINIEEITEPVLYRRLFKLNDHSGKYRTLDLLANSHYQIDKDTKNVVVLNAYRSVNDNMIKYAQKARILSGLIGYYDDETEFALHTDIKLINNVEKEVGVVSTLIENALGIVQNTSTEQLLPIFRGMTCKYLENTLVHGESSTNKLNHLKMQAQMKQDKDDVLLYDIYLNLNMANAPIYYNKVESFISKKAVKNKELQAGLKETLEQMKDRMVRLMKISYDVCKRYASNPYYNPFGMLRAAHMVLPTSFKTMKTTDFLDNYYMFTVSIWYNTINPFHLSNVSSTFKLSIPNIMQDFPIYKKFNNKFDVSYSDKSEVDAIPFKKMDSCKVSGLFENTLEFMRKNYSYYDEETLPYGDLQEAVPSRLKFLISAMAADKIETGLLFYAAFKRVMEASFNILSDAEIVKQIIE